MLDWIHDYLTGVGSSTAEPSGDRESGDSLPTPVDTDLALARDLVTEEVEAAESTFWTAWNEYRDLDESLAALRTWHGWRTALATLETAAPADRLTFQVDSLVLQDCYRTLFAEPSTESIVYLTGLVLEPQLRTLNRCLELDLAVESAVRAEADPDASFAALHTLERNGHRLLGHCHNHTGTGIANTTPSSTDRDYQHRLEANGYETIGMIMTQDGYVRFFSTDRAFTIEVYGTNVTRKEEHVFRLEESIRKPRPHSVDA